MVRLRDDGESTASATAYAPIQSAQNDKQPFPSKSKHRNCTNALRNTEDSWLVETICVVLGAVLFIALYLVLEVYDGQAAPQFGSAFGSSLTLNTIVAIIAAGAKVLLLYPVAECIGQLRWIWFSRDYRQLNDFATFDRAARGSMWSGFELLWTTKMRSLASVGAFITLFAVAIDPLSQQLVSYHPGSVETNDTVARLPRAIEYHELGTNLDVVIVTGPDTNALLDIDEDPGDYAWISVGMKSAIRSGFVSGNERVLEVAATCPGGNCTFEEYSTLAVCASFADVTEHLYPTNRSTNKKSGNFEVQLHLTQDHFLAQYADDELLSQGNINVSSVATSFKSDRRIQSPSFLDFNQSIVFKDIAVPLADIFVITRNGTAKARPEQKIGDVEMKYAAFEIALSWCVQTYTTEIVNGVSTTHKVSANQNFTYAGGRSAYLSNDAPDGHRVNGWTVDPKHHAALQWHLKRLFQGERSETGMFIFPTTTSDSAQVLYDSFDELSYRTPQNNLSDTLHQTEREGLQLIFDNVATSMTNYIRRGNRRSSSSEEDLLDPAVSVQGTVWTQVNLVHIRWPWIAAHASFALFSIGLLVATMLSHRASPLRGHEPWKSSGVAILHALEPDLQREMRGVAKMSEMQARGEGRVVRLEEGDNGWRLVEVEREEDGRGA